MSMMEIIVPGGNLSQEMTPIAGLAAGPEGGGHEKDLNKNVSNYLEHVGARCYSVDRPIMQDSHSCDWGSNPHSSILF